jgi:hypothetical protein
MQWEVGRVQDPGVEGRVKGRGGANKDIWMKRRWGGRRGVKTSRLSADRGNNGKEV